MIDDKIDDLSHQNNIDAAIQNALAAQLNTDVVATKVYELNNKTYGKCCCCGSWVSNQDDSDSVSVFSDGCIINQNWWCDLCLPPNHPKHF